MMLTLLIIFSLLFLFTCMVVVPFKSRAQPVNAPVNVTVVVNVERGYELGTQEKASKEYESICGGTYGGNQGKRW